MKVKILRYDEESDCLYVSIGSRQSHLTFELSRRIAVDLDRQNRVLGVEIIDASKVISDLFHKKVAKGEIKDLLCRIDKQDTINLRFGFRGREEHASLALPSFYKSPLLTVS